MYITGFPAGLSITQALALLTPKLRKAVAGTLLRSTGPDAFIRLTFPTQATATEIVDSITGRKTYYRTIHASVPTPADEPTDSPQTDTQLP